MPWRLIIFIVIFAVFLVFISFNLENKCDISFGLFKLEQVPVFITIFSSFVLGLLCALPLVIHIKKKRKERRPNETSSRSDNDSHAEDDAPSSDTTDPAEARKKFLNRKKS